MEGDASRIERRKEGPPLSYLWIAVLGWTVLGEVLTQGFMLAGQIGPHCEPASIAQTTYPICEPCKLRWGSFAVVEINDCPNDLLQWLMQMFIAIPHLIIVMLTLLAYPLEEALRLQWTFLPALVLIMPLAVLLARTAYVNFVARPRFGRGVHRALLLCLVMLVVNFAMFSGGAWPWLK